MREFCWKCHRPSLSCFCHLVRPFQPSVDFALIVHPNEVNSTVGTAWILRRSIPNLTWIRSNGDGLDQNGKFLELLQSSETSPLLLFPDNSAFNLNQASDQEWQSVAPKPRRPLFIVIDGSWSEARGILRKSPLLRSLRRVSFEASQPSEYGFKRQPHPACLSCVEGVHRVIETLALRQWGSLPSHREHDAMITIFRKMVEFQKTQTGKKALQKAAAFEG